MMENCWVISEQKQGGCEALLYVLYHVLVTYSSEQVDSFAYFCGKGKLMFTYLSNPGKFKRTQRSQWKLHHTIWREN